MKVACVTDDGRTISQHFGRAAYYAVLTVEDGDVVERELRDKVGHQHFASQDQDSSQHHGLDAASHNKHVSMAKVISDCEALLCRGMGYGAYASMQQLEIKPVVTDVEDIEEAVQAYVEGRLQDHPEKLH